MWNIECPFCKKRFNDDPWEGGECPGCGEEYYWDEQYDQETEECWETIEWDRLDREYIECLKKKRIEKENGSCVQTDDVKSSSPLASSSPVKI